MLAGFSSWLFAYEFSLVLATKKIFMTNNDDLFKALNSSENELYAIIGYLTTEELHGSPASKDDLIDMGRKWFIKNQDAICAKLCKNLALRKLAEGEHTPAELGLIIIEFFVQQKLNIPLIPVSALLVKSGIKSFCHEFWKND